MDDDFKNMYAKYCKAIENKELEITLPEYVKHDIEALCKEYDKEKSSVLDCWYNEVQGSINSAEADDVITFEEAKYLRMKYLGY